MAVKILIKRKIPENIKETLFNPLIRRLRILATQQSGYISGETLRRIDRPTEYLVISTWKDIDAWKAWQENPERAEIQNQIDVMLDEPTQYEIYGHL
ncbi:MAG: antibiotic biosynthesis monooxygenase family protein [Syntrophales bacterium]|nr:antibiotic biosynthesis monooxygenase family protein [Syntrophales bacterium]